MISAPRFSPYTVLDLPLYSGLLNGSQFMSRDHYGHRCTVTGALWTPQGRVFDGDDYIEAGANASLVTLAQGTIMGWIKTTVNPNDNFTNIIFGVHDSGDSVSFAEFSVHRRAGDGAGLRLIWGMYEDGTNKVEGYTGLVMSLDVWYHVALVVSATGNTLYVDGAAQGATYTVGSAASALFFSTVTAVDNSSIGASKRSDAYAANRYFRGTINELLVLGRGLLRPEIQNHRLATKWRYR